MIKKDVNSAFEILLEQIEAIFHSLNEDIDRFSRSQDYEKVKVLGENAKYLVEFKEKVKTLQKDWKTIFSDKLVLKKNTRKKSEKLRRGLKTNEKEFRIPILESLIELGGQAEMRNVLQKVSIKMENKLNKYDKESLPSGANQIRWENTAQWCRNTLVNEGFLSSESPRGIWEITDFGREYLDRKKINNF